MNSTPCAISSVRPTTPDPVRHRFHLDVIAPAHRLARDARQCFANSAMCCPRGDLEPQLSVVIDPRLARSFSPHMPPTIAVRERRAEWSISAASMRENLELASITACGGITSPIVRGGPTPRARTGMIFQITLTTFRAAPVDAGSTAAVTGRSVHSPRRWGEFREECRIARTREVPS